MMTKSKRTWQGGGVQRAYALAEKMANKAGPIHLLPVPVNASSFLLKRWRTEALEALSLVAPADTDARRALAGLTRQPRGLALEASEPVSGLAFVRGCGSSDLNLES